MLITINLLCKGFDRQGIVEFPEIHGELQVKWRNKNLRHF
jgi:hypothetical protein